MFSSFIALGTNRIKTLHELSSPSLDPHHRRRGKHTQPEYIITFRISLKKIKLFVIHDILPFPHLFIMSKPLFSIPKSDPSLPLVIQEYIHNARQVYYLHLLQLQRQLHRQLLRLLVLLKSFPHIFSMYKPPSTATEFEPSKAGQPYHLCLLQLQLQLRQQLLMQLLLNDYTSPIVWLKEFSLLVDPTFHFSFSNITLVLATIIISPMDYPQVEKNCTILHTPIDHHFLA